jgi:ribosomal protein L11
MKTPQTTYLIKQATGIKFGASKPGDEVSTTTSKPLVEHQ